MLQATSSTLLEGADGSVVRLTTLPGGLRVVTEFVPAVQSASFGVWVDAGSRDEPAAQMGSAHFLEHLLFKGTSKRDAMTISASIESVGGDLNAYTTKEHTCYYARLLGRDLPIAIDVISDVITDALLNDADIEAERSVILEEIAMVEDEPSDVVHDAFAQQMFGDSPLGRPILGTSETILGLPNEAIRSFYRERYRAPKMVVAAAGAVNHESVVASVAAAFGGALHADSIAAEPRPRGEASVAAPGIRLVARPIEQANLVLGVPGLTRADDRRYAMAILTTALGGGMSSRLFQEVREKRGLAYSVYAYTQGFVDSGLFGIYAGCLPTKVQTVIDVCREQLADLASQGVTTDELERSKGQVIGSTILGQEDTGSRMGRIAKAILHDEPLLSIPELLNRIDAVTKTDVDELAAALLNSPKTMAVIGPFDSPDDFGPVA